MEKYPEQTYYMSLPDGEIGMVHIPSFASLHLQQAAYSCVNSMQINFYAGVSEKRVFDGHIDQIEHGDYASEWMMPSDLAVVGGRYLAYLMKQYGIVGLKNNEYRLDNLGKLHIELYHHLNSMMAAYSVMYYGYDHRGIAPTYDIDNADESLRYMFGDGEAYKLVWDGVGIDEEVLFYEDDGYLNGTYHLDSYLERLNWAIGLFDTVVYPKARNAGMRIRRASKDTWGIMSGERFYDMCERMRNDLAIEQVVLAAASGIPVSDLIA